MESSQIEQNKENLEIPKFDDQKGTNCFEGHERCKYRIKKGILLLAFEDALIAFISRDIIMGKSKCSKKLQKKWRFLFLTYVCKTS